MLAGAAAVDPALGPLPWLLALVLFLWTPPHFWSLAILCREDYAAAVMEADGYTVVSFRDAVPCPGKGGMRG